MPAHISIKETVSKMIEIIEKAIVGKRNMQECEDGIIANERFVAVIDGSTSKTPRRINPDMSNGKFCMELVKQYISSMPGDIDVRAFCNGVTQAVRSIYKAFGVDINRLEGHPEERLTASVGVYSHHYRQIWLVGDCQCIADDVYHDNSKPQEKTLAEKRSAFLITAIKNGLNPENVQTEDPGRHYILAELTECCKKQNIEYPVVDGFDIPISKVKVIDVHDCGKGIVLATDGYPFLYDTLANSEEALAAQLNNDPLCIYSFKATKGFMEGNRSFDDRGYVRFVDRADE